MSVETLFQTLICLLCFGLPTAYLLRLIWLGRASRSWPTVEGTITRSRVRSWLGSRGGSRTNTRHYAPEICYEYTVDGIRRTGHIVAFGRTWNTGQTSAEHTVETYPVGKAVRVAHHPRNPDLATLETQAIRRVHLFALITAGLLSTALYGIATGT